MIDKTIKQKLADRKVTRGSSMEYFFAPFNITESSISKLTDLKEGEINVDGFKMFNHMSYIVTNLMVSKEITEFILRMCILREEAAAKFGFEEEFDWIKHCVVSAQLHAGKGDQALRRYSWIHGNDIIINHYALKAWNILLDAQHGKTEELWKYLPSLKDKF